MFPRFPVPIRILLASALLCLFPQMAWAAGEAGNGGILTVMTFTPMLGALLVLLVPRGREDPFGLGRGKLCQFRQRRIDCRAYLLQRLGC